LTVPNTYVRINERGHMSYYVYENWTAESKAVVHVGFCGHCNDGQGCHLNPLGNRNGKWHGPFLDFENAVKFANQTGRSVRRCRCTALIQGESYEGET